MGIRGGEDAGRGWSQPIEHGMNLNNKREMGRRSQKKEEIVDKKKERLSPPMT